MQDYTYYVQLLLSGITVGSLYALIAIGYTMVYGILRLINFAHGDMFMMAGFFTIYLMAVPHMPVWAAIILTLSLIHILKNAGVSSEKSERCLLLLILPAAGGRIKKEIPASPPEK